MWPCFVISYLLVLSNVSLFAMCYLTEPHLQDLTNGHTITGQGINLQCTVTSNHPYFTIEWNAPLNLNLTLDRVNITRVIENHPGTYKMTSIYSISESTTEDSSIYYCTAVDTQNVFYSKYTYIWVPVYGTNAGVIQFFDNFVVDQVNSEVHVFTRAHPNTNFYWVNNKTNETISTKSKKFTFGTTSSNKFSNYDSFLKFNRLSGDDFGNYTIVAQNRYGRKSFEVSVNVTGPPRTSLQVQEFDNETYIVKCQTTAFPKPKIEWEFDVCHGLACFLRNCSGSFEKRLQWTPFRSEDVGLETSSFVTVNKSNSGQLRAVSFNELGRAVSEQYVYENQEDFEVFSPNMIKSNHSTKVESVFKDDIEIVCSVSLSKFYHEIKWYRHGRNLSLDDIKAPIKGFDEYHIKNFDAIYSSVSILRINIDKTDEGEYFCVASSKNGSSVSRRIELVVKELPTLNVASNMQNKTVRTKMGSSWKFYCNMDGYPTPFVRWYKDNLTISSSPKFSLRDNNQTLVINNIALSDKATYKCMVTNRFNTTTKLATLISLENDFDWLLVTIILLSLILLVVTIFIIIKTHKDNKLKKELKAAGLANFEKGALESINPELGLQQQAEFLPYDKKFEIEATNLKLGKELGSGAFGVVVKGELLGAGPPIIVAVKTVNKFAGHDCIKALVSELKIMVHIGRHINIVNLIGACTKEITKKKLLVVVEFCPFGNLHDYILKNSNSFVDQRKEDSFDWSIHYTTLSLTTNEPQKKFICSHDFLVWAFQVAKGMEYLASNKVLHGDLAARNVLLSDNNVVKISDFGLARNMYKNDIYKKTTNEPLPVKWMAVESIGENIFSTQSDVWSFGVVLWEFFSLSKTPYPGMPVDQAFYQKLANGYRMDKPQFATMQIYQIMMDCWDATPSSRPSFSQLAERIAKLLEASIKNHYLEMNSCYVLMKNPQSDGCGIDYMSMISSTPNYVSNINYFHGYQNTASYIADANDEKDLHQSDEV